jgi:hypothetical protein
LPLQVDLFIVVPCNGGADLGWLFAKLSLLISKKAFLGTGGALSPMQPFKTTAQAGVPESSVAAAVAGKLIQNAAHLGGLLINVFLPWIPEVLTGKLRSGQYRRKRTHFERSRGMISRNILSRIGPLSIAHGGNRKDGTNG